MLLTMVIGILFQVVIFAGVFFLMRHFMQGHVSGAMGHLHKLNDELMKQQAELKQKIADAEKEYQSKVSKANQEVNTLQIQAKQEFTKTMEDARARAMSEREKLINEAVETRDKMRQEVMAEMEEKAILHSKELIAQFFTGEIRKQVHDCLVEDVIKGIKENKMELFQIPTSEAEIRTAEPLEAAVKEKLRKVVSEKIKKEVSFKEEVDETLIGGLVLRFGTFVIDGSLTNRLKESSMRLKKETARRFQGKT